MNFLMKSVLESQYRVIAVENVYQGLNELKRNDDVDMVIVDLDQHVSESWDFIRHLKSSSFYQKPVIVLTGDKSEKMEQIIAEEKVYDFFFKPFYPPDLVRSIEKLLEADTMYN